MTTRFFRLVLALVLITAMTGCSAAPTLPVESIERFETQPDVAFLPKEYTIAQMCEESDLVVVGRVTKHFNVAYPTESNPERCQGHALVQIEEVLLGNTSKRTLDVQDACYIDEESGIEVTAWGAPMMRKGHRVLLFLNLDPYILAEDREPAYTVLHAELGKFFADEQGLFHPAVTLSASYKNGKTHMSLDNMEPRTLDAIRWEIEDAVNAEK